MHTKHGTLLAQRSGYRTLYTRHGEQAKIAVLGVAPDGQKNQKSGRLGTPLPIFLRDCISAEGSMTEW